MFHASVVGRLCKILSRGVKRSELVFKRDSPVSDRGVKTLSSK